MKDLQTLLKEVENELRIFGLVKQQYVRLNNIFLSVSPKNSQLFDEYTRYTKNGNYDLANLTIEYEDGKRVIRIITQGSHKEQKDRMLKTLRVLKRSISNYRTIRGKDLKVA